MNKNTSNLKVFKDIVRLFESKFPQYSNRRLRFEAYYGPESYNVYFYEDMKQRPDFILYSSPVTTREYNYTLPNGKATEINRPLWDIDSFVIETWPPVQ